MGRRSHSSSSSRSRSRSRSSSSSRSRSRSRSPRKDRRSRSRSKSPQRGKRLSSIAASRDVSPPRRNRKEEPRKRKFAYDKRSESEDESKYEYGRQEDRCTSFRSNSFYRDNDKEKEKDKEKKKPKPNFALSGKLSEEQRTTERGAVLNFVEPPEARKPKIIWRLYPFKGEEALDPIFLHKQSAYLIGRDRTVVHIPVDHPSCSKQHAVIQWRLVEVQDPETGDKFKQIKPYIMDLESTNGTFLGDEKIKSRRYYELKEKDVIKFGFSTREYVVIKDDERVEESD